MRHARNRITTIALLLPLLAGCESVSRSGNVIKKREAGIFGSLHEIWVAPQVQPVGLIAARHIHLVSHHFSFTQELRAIQLSCVDESDRIVDLHQKAIELRDQRLERMRRKRRLVSGDSPSEDSS